MGLCRSLAPGGDDDRGLFIVKAFLDTRFCVRSGTEQVQRKACLDEVAVADLVIVLLGGSCRRQLPCARQPSESGAAITCGILSSTTREKHSMVIMRHNREVCSLSDILSRLGN